MALGKHTTGSYMVLSDLRGRHVFRFIRTPFLDETRGVHVGECPRLAVPFPSLRDDGSHQADVSSDRFNSTPLAPLFDISGVLGNGCGLDALYKRATVSLERRSSFPIFAVVHPSIQQLREAQGSSPWDLLSPRSSPRGVIRGDYEIHIALVRIRSGPVP
ncbi:hypothetical protein JAAARDRAFT_539793 [Jaapia argillacea MUCL 33604]|uniref:Uncharacterized protein n=1 Tax=Jaapia argillacea MUCL 33604 TaxID=933084 RepID=A0A067P8S5_9AGAM|nr:hypothetical protein JAAARDRAFT_539793 [Jaapia argillacea MUCL 33604]